MTRSLSNFYNGNYVVRGAQVRRVIDVNDRFAQQMRAIEQEQARACKAQLEEMRQQAIAQGAAEDDPQFQEGIFAEKLQLLEALEANEAKQEQQESEEEQIDYVEQARAEAAQILADAQREAEALHTQAQADADALREQARTEGYQEGHDTATREAEEMLRAKQDALAKQERAQNEAFEWQLSQLEPRLLDTMLTVFDEVFQMQFCGKRELLLHLVKNAMRGIRETKHYRIRVCEEEVAYLREHKVELQDKVGDDVTVEIVMDATLSESQCIIDADSGLYDCSLDAEMENLIRDLKSLSVRV